jgi:hypothetical protein
VVLLLLGHAVFNELVEGSGHQKQLDQKANQVQLVSLVVGNAIHVGKGNFSGDQVPNDVPDDWAVRRRALDYLMGLEDVVSIHRRGGVRLHDPEHRDDQVLVGEVRPLAVGIIDDPNVLCDQIQLLLEAEDELANAARHG